MQQRTIIKHVHVTEKTNVLVNLANATSNKCLARCKTSQYVFVVDRDANKHMIKKAFEELYKDVHVTSVNTINCKGKQKRVRGRMGRTSSWKKAIITLREGETIDLTV
ncbi:MAG: 50S ribosomal protein L23 [Chlamydiae bacterium]|nr:50S ribosomal protein L23 [Chlamydiota bacterium]